VVSIRGSSPEQVLVLVNGHRLNSAQGGGVDMSTISTDMIERIEIMRGGGSAVYGENAVGGVINIITRDGYGEKLSAMLKYSAGLFNTHTVGGSLSSGLGPEDRFDLFFSGEGLYTAGNYRFEDLNAGQDYRERSNESGLRGTLAGKLGWDISPGQGLRLTLAGNYNRSKKGVPGLKEFPSSNAVMHNEQAAGVLSFGFYSNRIASLSLDLHGQLRNRHYKDPQYFLGSMNDKHSLRNAGTDLVLKRRDGFKFLKMQNTVAWHLRYDYLQTTAMQKSGDTILENACVKRWQNSIAWRGDFHFFPWPQTGNGRFSFFSSVRLDIDELYGNNFNFNLGWMLPLDKEKKTMLKGNAGTGYRVPSFNDLFWPATSFAVGNSDLLPEKAVIYDIGLLTRPLSFFSFEAVYFGHHVRNLIQWQPGPDGRWRPGNIGKARLRGAEVETVFLFRFTQLKLFLEVTGNYTYLFATDITAGSPSYGKQLP
ncbi:MAG TPA: TonB-dependent receptor, partial [Spirochaetota bacterium]|nr:TonB-dependent receptor [Spirochaetota bacterium]